MKTNDRFFQAGGMLAGAVVIAATMATRQAMATDHHLRANPSKIILCSNTRGCSGGTNNGSGPGVVGTANGVGDGVDATSASNNGLGAVTNNPSSLNGGRSGVFGVDGSSDGGTGNVGVTGLSNSGTGVRGQSTTGVGVAGWSNNGPAIDGFALATGAVALQGTGSTSGDSSGINLATYQANGTAAFWVTNDSNAHVNGKIFTAGSCSKGCASTDRVVSYAAQSSAPMLEDVGEARLSGGEAHIAIDAALARAIDQGAPYVVFVTPEGQSHGLYVTNKTSSGFTVAENDGGRSSIPFGYRIVAKPYGAGAARLPVVRAANMPHPVRPAHMRSAR